MRSVSSTEWVTGEKNPKDDLQFIDKIQIDYRYIVYNSVSSRELASLEPVPNES